MSLTREQQQKSAYVRSLINGEGLKAREAAEKDRAPLKRDEYYALKFLMSLGPAVMMVRDQLGKRLSGIKYAKRNIGMALYCMDQLENMVLDTAPVKQLKQLQHEIENSEVFVRTKSFTPYNNDATDYVPISREDLKTLITYAVQYECDVCEKHGKEAKKCPLNQLLRTVAVYEAPALSSSGECFFNNYQFEASDIALVRLKETEGQQ